MKKQEGETTAMDSQVEKAVLEKKDHLCLSHPSLVLMVWHQYCMYIFHVTF